jgi:hypothetical protein
VVNPTARKAMIPPKKDHVEATIIVVLYAFINMIKNEMQILDEITENTYQNYESEC